MGLFYLNMQMTHAQEMIAADIDVSNNPVVVAAYAMSQSPSGVQFREKTFERSSKQWFDGDLETANIVFASSPEKESSYSWRGRREGFMGNYAKAIEIFTQGMELFPDSYALHRYRGYFLIRNYQFEEGIRDLRRAEELIENEDVSLVQAGIPGRSNFSPSTFKRNIYYYLAESSMASGDYETVINYMDKAVEANQLRDKDDLLVSTSFYKYMAMRKLGRHDEAIQMIMAIPRELEIIANEDYFNAVQYLQGRYSREQYLTMADSLGLYTIAMVDLFEDKNADAKEIFTLTTNNNHKGYWLAEVELLNLD